MSTTRRDPTRSSANRQQLAPTAHSVRSADGTIIRWRESGRGRPVLFVHGSLADGECWSRVVSLMDTSWRCVVVDRRGHGASGWTEPYSIVREYEDIVAVLDDLNQPISVVAHSFGALCVLGSAPLCGWIDRLVLYEPALPIGGPAVPASVLRDIRDAVATGDLDLALSIGMSKLVETPDADIAKARGRESWARSRELVATWVAEISEIERLGADVNRFRSILSPTMLLVGSDSPSENVVVRTTRALATAIPNARVVELAGQRHQAHVIAPVDFTQAVREFLDGVAAPEQP